MEVRALNQSDGRDFASVSFSLFHQALPHISHTRGLSGVTLCVSSAAQRHGSLTAGRLSFRLFFVFWQKDQNPIRVSFFSNTMSHTVFQFVVDWRGFDSSYRFGAVKIHAFSHSVQPFATTRSASFVGHQAFHPVTFWSLYVHAIFAIPRWVSEAALWLP